MGLPTLFKYSLKPGMGEKQSDLDKIIAIDYIADWFKERLESSEAKSISDRVIIAESATGSGKSTTLPSELYIRFKSLIKGTIIITEPRVVTTLEIANTISNIDAYKEHLKMGQTIGYVTKDYIKKPIEKGILFSSIGVLLQYLKNTPAKDFVKKYKIIMLDEAQDRSISFDLILYYLKVLSTKVSLKDMPFIVIMSATLDVKKYANYFETKTIFKISGTSYPIQDNFLNYNSTNAVKSAIDTIENIHTTNVNDEKNKSDIVVFIPGQSFIKKVKDGIIELNNKLDNKIIPIALDSTIFKSANIDYQNVFTNLEKLKIDGSIPTRKVICGTNAIETGITIPSLKYSFDLGLVNQLEYNPVLSTNLLMIKPVSQAMSLQRRGRVGRIMPGVFYAMYTKETFNKLIEIQYPEILITDITIPILNIIVLNYGEIYN